MAGVMAIPLISGIAGTDGMAGTADQSGIAGSSGIVGAPVGIPVLAGP